ncbi:MAG: hypothetical protein E7Z63_03325 [Thermoplasmata archaeon]|nr:hypothetical protein [Thermoplasmata archaeon]
MASDDFERFVKEHREEILRILGEDEPKRTAEDIRDSFAKAASDMLKVMADPEVQKHFFNGCMEFIQCMEAAVKAMPLSDEMRSTVEQAEKTRDTTAKNAAKAGVKATAKSKLEKVSITPRKKKAEPKEE